MRSKEKWNKRRKIKAWWAVLLRFQVSTVHDQQPEFTGLLYKGIDLSRQDQDVQYVDDDPSSRHMIDTLHMLIIYPSSMFYYNISNLIKTWQFPAGLHNLQFDFTKEHIIIWGKVLKILNSTPLTITSFNRRAQLLTVKAVLPPSDLSCDQKSHVTELLSV